MPRLRRKKLLLTFLNSLVLAAVGNASADLIIYP